MAVRHSLELTNDSCDDDVQTIRTGNSNTFSYSSFIHSNQILLILILKPFGEIDSTRNHMDLHSSCNHCCHRIRRAVSGMEHCPTRLDCRACLHAFLCHDNICLCLYALGLLQISSSCDWIQKPVLHGCC